MSPWQSALVALALCATACGGSTVSAPTGPTTAAVSAVRLTVSPVPVPLRAQGAAQYQVTADATFHETSGIGARITRLDVSAINATGEGTPLTIGFDLTLPASGTVSLPIVGLVSAPAGQSPSQLRLGATGIDQSGHAITIDAVQVPLVVTTGGDAPGAPDAVLIGAGDIADCAAGRPAATASLLDRLTGAVFTLGDHVYPRATAELFSTCYGPTWGRHAARTRPTPGNHDWDGGTSSAYFSYFGSAAGSAGAGFYSYALGSWHILSLNSNVPANPGSAQYEWARIDLDANPTTCTLAYWHHPLFSSGPNGNNGQMREMWRLLQERGVEVVLAAHDHDYERFAPQNADGAWDPRGIREFVVGTGGAPLYQPRSIQPNSEVRDSRAWGVLKLTLHARSYDWEFVPVDGQSFRDGGSTSCLP